MPKMIPASSALLLTPQADVEGTCGVSPSAFSSEGLVSEAVTHSLSPLLPGGSLIATENQSITDMQFLSYPVCVTY